MGEERGNGNENENENVSEQSKIELEALKELCEEQNKKIEEMTAELKEVKKMNYKLANNTNTKNDKSVEEMLYDNFFAG